MCGRGHPLSRFLPDLPVQGMRFGGVVERSLTLTTHTCGLPRQEGSENSPATHVVDDARLRLLVQVCRPSHARSAGQLPDRVDKLPRTPPKEQRANMRLPFRVVTAAMMCGKHAASEPLCDHLDPYNRGRACHPLCEVRHIVKRAIEVPFLRAQQRRRARSPRLRAALPRCRIAPGA